MIGQNILFLLLWFIILFLFLPIENFNAIGVMIDFVLVKIFKIFSSHCFIESLVFRFDTAVIIQAQFFIDSITFLALEMIIYVQKGVLHEFFALWIVFEVDWISRERHHHENVEKYIYLDFFWRFMHSPKYLNHFLNIVAHCVTNVGAALNEIIEEFLHQFFVLQLDELLVVRVEEGRVDDVSLCSKNVDSFTLFKERSFLNNVQQALIHLVTVKEIWPLFCELQEEFITLTPQVLKFFEYVIVLMKRFEEVFVILGDIFRVEKL